MLHFFMEQYQKYCTKLAILDGLPALSIRLLLAPVFWSAGFNKYQNFSATVQWFEHSLNLPFPELMVSLVMVAEMAGAIFLALGFLTRLASLPLIISMIVAIVKVHWVNGWQAIADTSSPFVNTRVIESSDKLQAANQILQTHGNYDWLTSSGNFAIVNNGIEFAVIYLVMLLALLNMGGGRLFSVDYFLIKYFHKKSI